MGNPIEVYIDPASGDDSNDGTIGSPYATVQGAYDDTTLGTDGTRFNVKAGTADVTSNTTLSLTNGTPAAPIFIQGYTSAAGDGGRGHINTGTVNLFGASYNYMHVQDMEITCSTIAQGIYGSLINSILHGNYSAVSSYCKLMANTINGTVTIKAGTEARYNKITHSSGYGITVNGQGLAQHNIIVSESGATGGILLSGHDSEAVNNSLYASATVSYGINHNDSSYVVGAYNNLLAGSYTTALRTNSDVNKATFFCNSSHGHTTLEDFSAEPWYQTTSFENTTLSETPYTDAPNGDFTPKNIANVNDGFGMGTLFRGAVSPSTSGGGGGDTGIEVGRIVTGGV